jgi:hypothetical protein
VPEESGLVVARNGSLCYGYLQAPRELYLYDGLR